MIARSPVRAKGRSMDVLEELTEFEDQIDRDHIERRIDDWLRRIENLYSDVRSWLPPGWSAKSGNIILLNDDLMERFDVPGQALPTLLLVHGGALRGRLEPRGFRRTAVDHNALAEPL